MKKLLFLTGILFIGLVLVQCNKLNTYSDVIDSGGGMPDPEVTNEKVVTDSYDEERDGVKWTCTTESVSIQEGAGGNGGYPLFSPNSGVIYPGNLLQGASLHKSTPDLIAVDRAGGVISTDIFDGNIQSFFEVDVVSKSQVTSAINNIIAGSSGVVPANFNIDIKNIQSREEFALELGIDVNSTFYDLEAKLGYDSESEKNTFVVNLNQSFYTMSYDVPTSYDKVFASTVTPEELSKYVSPTNPATYISDVTYGRIYYMLVSSSSSITEMDAAINASFNAIETKVDAEIETSYMSSLKELKISVFAYGGDSETSLLTVGTTDIHKLSTLLAQSSIIESGKPISYVVRSLYDNRIVSTQLATNYDVTNCMPSGPDGAPPYTEHWTGEVISRMGPVGAAYNTTGSEFVLISKDGKDYMVSNTGKLEGPYSIDNLGAGQFPMDGIGAACNIDGNAFGKPFIQLFDHSGTNYTYLNPETGKYLSVRPISQLAQGDNPFGAVGIGAVGFNFKDEDGPSNRYVFNKQGTHYALYKNNPNEFGNTYQLYKWGPDHSITEHFSEIGAIIGFYIGNTRYFLMFNGAGTKYIMYGDINGNGTEVIGPFDL